MNDVPPLRFGEIPRPAFGQAAQHLPNPKTNRADRRYQRLAKTAGEVLPQLPAVGESIHCLMTGHYDLCQVIVAVAEYLPRLEHLRIATLCFSKRNAALLKGLLETRPGLRFTLLAGMFFKGYNKEFYERFAEELKEYPGARLAAAESHAKVATFDLGDGDGLTLEGSANLRTNSSIEQLTAIRDGELARWHSGWIDGLVKGDGGG